MPKRSFQQYQKSTKDENQIPQNKTRRSNRWMAAVLVLTTTIGGVIGYFSLPNHVSDVVDPGYSLSAEGVRFFAVLGGAGAAFLLVALLFYVSNEIIVLKSRRASFWWKVLVPTTATVGAILGSIYLPGILLFPIRVSFGIIIGLVGLFILIAIIQNPAEFFAEGVLAFLESGCCLATVVLFIALTGTISGLLVWHSLLLGVPTEATSALVALIIFVGLALPNRKEEVFHRSKANAPLVSLE